MKTTRLLVTVAIAATGALLAPATAFAADSSSSPSTEAVVTPDPVVILGGTTQSTDPTRYDYVPAKPAGIDGLVTPQNAVGYAYVAAFTFGWKGFNISVPAVNMFHTLNGSGLTVTGESVGYLYGNIANVQVCNYQTQFQNRYGSTIYSTRKSALHAGCSYAAFNQSIPGTFSVKTGVQCARYYVNGTYRGEQCHQVFP